MINGKIRTLPNIEQLEPKLFTTKKSDVCIEIYFFLGRRTRVDAHCIDYDFTESFRRLSRLYVEHMVNLNNNENLL